jgi:Ca-activated chloride channel family protein
MIKRTLFLCVAAMAIVLASGAATAPQVPGAIKVEVHLVEVYATVHDHKGGYVDGLARDNFQVFDDGQAERITNFETSGQSLSCGILLDTTGSMAEALPRVKNSIVKLIDALDPQDSVGIYTFDSQLTIRQEFTTDKQEAKRAILRTRAEGQTALFDALSEAAQEVATRPGKKVLIVFTDGDDNASALNATAAIARAKKLGIPLYAIAEGEATHSHNLRKILDELSERTGGATYQVKKPNEIEEVFAKISEELKHLYMIAYQPPANAGDSKWHKIEVAVRGVKDYRIRAREGYFPQ